MYFHMYISRQKKDLDILHRIVIIIQKGEGMTHYFKSNDYCVLEVIGITFFPSKSCTCKSPENPGSEVIR